jgi:hypothetical protein
LFCQVHVDDLLGRHLNDRGQRGEWLALELHGGQQLQRGQNAVGRLCGD